MISASNEICRAQPLLGTIVEIRVAVEKESITFQAIHKAFAAIQRVHDHMSFHDPRSDISKLNREGHRRPIRVDPWTREVLKKAVKLSQQTNGLFDMTVAPKLVRWGFLPKIEDGVRRPLAGAWRHVYFEKDGKVGFLKPLLIDLGGIAKGFAVDRAVDTLQNFGVKAGLVNAGGDMRVFGNREMPVLIRDPNSPRQRFHRFTLYSEALATSGNYFTYHHYRGQKVFPLVHPKTLQPCRCKSITVAAPECWLADGLTKVVAVEGEKKEKKSSHLKKFGARVVFYSR